MEDLAVVVGKKQGDERMNGFRQRQDSSPGRDLALLLIAEVGSFCVPIPGQILRHNVGQCRLHREPWDLDHARPGCKD